MNNDKNHNVVHPADAPQVGNVQDRVSAEDVRRWASIAGIKLSGSDEVVMKLAEFAIFARAALSSPAKVGGDEREADIDAHVIDRFATILAEISLNLKGAEQPLHRHSYHDLPKLVAELKLEVELHRANEARAALSADGGAADDLYYVQDTRSFVGNCPMWWGKDFRGYVTRMDEAGRYTRAEAERICKRDTDKMWPCHMIDPLRRPTIDFQHLPTEEARCAAIAASTAKGE